MDSGSFAERGALGGLGERWWIRDESTKKKKRTGESAANDRGRNKVEFSAS